MANLQGLGTLRRVGHLVWEFEQFELDWVRCILRIFFPASNPTPRLIKSVHFSFFPQATKLNGFKFSGTLAYNGEME